MKATDRPPTWWENPKQNKHIDADEGWNKRLKPASPLELWDLWPSCGLIKWLCLMMESSKEGVNELAAVQSRAGDICCHFRAEEKGQKCLRLFSFCEDTCMSVTKSHTWAFTLIFSRKINAQFNNSYLYYECGTFFTVAMRWAKGWLSNMTEMPSCPVSWCLRLILEVAPENLAKVETATGRTCVAATAVNVVHVNAGSDLPL